MASWRTSGHAPQRLTRIMAAFSIASAMVIGAIAGGHGAVAQTETASPGTAAAAISPADSVLYIGFSLDLESDQWVLAEELLARAGVEESSSDILGELSEDATSQDLGEIEAFLGGEAALVVTSLDAFSDEAEDFSGAVGLPSTIGAFGDNQSDEAAAPGIAAPAGWAFVLQPSDIETATQQIESQIASDPAVTATESVYNGSTIWSTPENPTTGESAYAYTVVDGFIVLSETPADLEPFIDAAGGSGASLDTVAPFGQADRALAGDRLAFGYFDTTSIADDVSALDTSGLGLGDSLGELAGTANYTGMSIIADPAGFRFETVQIPADGVTTSTPGLSSGPPTFADDVPADALLMISGYDLGQGVVLQGLGLALVTAVNQGFSSSFDASTPVPVPTADELYAQSAQLLGFNLKTGFIDQMTGEFGVAVWGANAEDPSQIGAILTSGVESPATLADTLSKLSFLIQAGAQGEANVTTRAVGDYNVNTVTVPQDGSDPIVIEYGIVDGRFVLGVGNGVDVYTNGATTPLSEDEDYQAAMGALPADHSGVIYVNVSQAIALSEATSSSETVAFVDDPELCGQYSTQAAAQEAYDADPVGNFEMDWDFDGIACEDFFAPATPVATPVAVASDSPVRAFAGVSYEEDGLARTSSIVLIERD